MTQLKGRLVEFGEKAGRGLRLIHERIDGVLVTAEKANLVGAINEIALAGGGGGGGVAGVTSFNTRGGVVTLLSADVTAALGFTPYSAANPSGFITGINSGLVTTALGYTPTSVTGLTGIQSVAAFKTGLSLVKGDVGLGSVDNTADAGKNVLTAAGLTTARNINGVAFDGTGNITINAVDATARAPASRLISTTAPLTGGGDLSADRTLAVSTFGTGASGVVPASGGGTTNFLRADGSWVAPPGGGSVPTGTGFTHITAGAQDAAAKLVDTADVNDGQITLAKQANMATASLVYRKTAGAGAPEVQPLATLKTDLGLTGTNSGDQFTNITSSRLLGRVTAGFGAAEELTGTQSTALLDTFTSALKGLAPPSGGGTGNYLRADGAWASPPGAAGGYTVVTKTASYTETATSGELLIKADLAAGFTITLPTAVGNTAKFHIKKIQAAGLITIDGSGTETIDGGLTAVLADQYASITLLSDNVGWLIV